MLWQTDHVTIVNVDRYFQHGKPWARRWKAIVVSWNFRRYIRMLLGVFHGWLSEDYMSAILVSKVGVFGPRSGFPYTFMRIYAHGRPVESLTSEQC